jgi:hypothetical protein
MMADAARALRSHLALLKELRGDAERIPPRLLEVKRWQSQRLAASYADMSAMPRYRTATAFFLEDLYGPKDFSRRDQAMMRILPTMARILPASAVETAALAIELEALSEDLDHRVARALGPGPIDGASYAEAYRKAGTRQERERQVQLIEEVGRRLDALVGKPLVFRTLKLMRAPARMAGLEDLQDFLERGFDSFRRMDGASEFLALIRSRETAILNRLFSGEPNPFSA